MNPELQTLYDTLIRLNVCLEVLLRYVDGALPSEEPRHTWPNSDDAPETHQNGRG
jgi:hypothetical protein